MPMLVIPVALTLGFGHETDCQNFMRHKWYLRPLYYTQQLIMGYAISILAVYVYVPIGDIYYGLLNLFCHSKFKSKSFNHADWPAYKLFEQIGEAMPQFLIAITFYANNGSHLVLRGTSSPCTQFSSYIINFLMHPTNPLLVLQTNKKMLRDQIFLATLSS